MKKIVQAALFAGLLLAGCAEKKSEHNTLSRTEKEEGWQLLFDGETTDGWHGYLKKSVGEGWKAEDGLLVCLGKGGDIGGDILTNESFDNFILSLEWNIAKGGNSGIFYHVIEDEKYSAPYATGPEYQLIDDIGFESPLEEWQKTGADYAMYTANDTKKLNPAGEWNTSKIVFDHGHVEHWLNGNKIIEFTAWSDDWKKLKAESKWKAYPDYGTAKTGPVGLQDHGHAITFRNIKIKPLD